MKNLRILGSLALTFSVGLLTNCGTRLEWQPNSSKSAQEAKLELDFQVKETLRIRGQLDSVHKALRLFNAVLSDISKMLNKEGYVPKDSLTLFVRETQSVLKKASQGFVTHSENGNWSIKESINAPLLREDYACDKTFIEVAGRGHPDKKKGHEQVQVALRDCYYEKDITLLTMDTSLDEIVEVQLHPLRLNELLPKGRGVVDIDENCRIRIRPTLTEIFCDPFSHKAGNILLSFEGIKIKSDSEGLTTNIDARVDNLSDRKLLAKVLYHSVPGQPTDAKLVLNDEHAPPPVDHSQDNEEEPDLGFPKDHGTD